MNVKLKHSRIQIEVYQNIKLKQTQTHQKNNELLDVAFVWGALLKHALEYA